MWSNVFVGLHVKCRDGWHSLMELTFYRQIFQKYSNIKFHENPSSWSGVVPCGQTDRHDEPHSRSSQFCERAQRILKLFPHSVSAYYPFPHSVSAYYFSHTVYLHITLSHTVYLHITFPTQCICVLPFPTQCICILPFPHSVSAYYLSHTVYLHITLRFSQKQ